MSALKPHSEFDAKPMLSDVSGTSPARLETTFTEPPTAPSGDMPLSSNAGPLSTSARSTNSGDTRNCPRMPGRPLSDISSFSTGKPRIIMLSRLVPSPYSSRTDGSSCPMTSETLRAWLLRIVLAVKLVTLKGASITSVLPNTPRCAPRATCPSGSGKGCGRSPGSSAAAFTCTSGKTPSCADAEPQAAITNAAATDRRTEWMRDRCTLRALFWLETLSNADQIRG